MYEDWTEFKFNFSGWVVDNQTSCVDAVVWSRADAVAAASLKAVTMTAVIVAAVCGNMLVIVSVLRFERLRIVANSFLVSLAVADLLVALLVMPFNALQQVIQPLLTHDLLFLPISTIQSAMGKRLITHCCVSRLACSRLSGHIEPHSPDFKGEINTTTTVMN